MPITHVVQFSFKSSASRDAIKQVYGVFFALARACKLSETQTPYITQVKGGKDISVEGLQVRHLSCRGPVAVVGPLSVFLPASCHHLDLGPLSSFLDHIERVHPLHDCRVRKQRT